MVIIKSKSNIERKDYIYSLEKRRMKRVDFKLKVRYPRVNDKSMYKKYKGQIPLLEGINISETGICFKSKLFVKKGDFISFLLKINGNPSFWCIAEVKWSAFNDEGSFIGCEFYSLSMNQIEIIKKYVNSGEANEVEYGKLKSDS